MGKDGVVSREAWRRAGETGLLLTAIPEEYGGGGGDFLTSVIMVEELQRGMHSGPGFPAAFRHRRALYPASRDGGPEAQWLPKMAAGEIITAIAMTEPGAGSDLQGIRTLAKRDGDHFVINGQKTFITNGQLADLVIVACKTDQAAGAKGVSLILVETNSPGFSPAAAISKRSA